MKTADEAMALKGFFSEFVQCMNEMGADFQRFFDLFESGYREARTSRIATTPHLDVLRVFGLEYSELRHSDALAWFLKPTSEHEQGPLFASALLQRLGLQPDFDERYTVLRERHGRTDVAMYAPEKFAVFIENKVRHFERERQVSDMVDELVSVSRAYGIPRERRFAIFLTDTGARSITGPEADSREFLIRNLHAIRRLELFELFRDALQSKPDYSPILMGLVHSYLNTVRHIRSQLS